jgi:acetyltransferase-like isoleucine patch superfamily enzyme
MIKRHSANRIDSFSHGFKGLLGNLASLIIYPPILTAWLHEIRGVRIKNIANVYISFNVAIDNVYPEMISIGKDVWITRNVVILAHFNPSQGQRDALGDILCKEVKIDDGVFIGVNSVILPGVHIGKNSVVSAGSIVLNNIPENTVVSGNPARPLRYFKNG